MSISVQDPIVVGTIGAKAFLAQMVAAAQHLTLATVDLWTAGLTPTPSTVFADLVIATVGTWAEYVTKATTGWGAQAVDLSGRVYISATPELSWTGPAAGGGPTIQGYVVSSAQAGTPMLYSSKFASPKVMVDNTRVLVLVPTFTLPNVQLP